MRTQTQTASAFTRVELLVTLAIIAAMIAMLITAMAKAKAKSARLTCGDNLKRIGFAFRITRTDLDSHIFLVSSFTNANALDRTPNIAELLATADGQHSPYTYQIFGMISNELHTPKLLVCPADERKAHTNLNVVFDNAGNDPRHLVNQYVSYFSGKEVNEASQQMLDSGDRNIGTSGSGSNSAFGFSQAPDDNSGYAKFFDTNALNGTA